MYLNWNDTEKIMMPIKTVQYTLEIFYVFICIDE